MLFDGTTRCGSARSNSNKGDFQKLSCQNKCTHARTLVLPRNEEGNGSQAFRNIAHHQASRKCKAEVQVQVQVVQAQGRSPFLKQRLGTMGQT
jgi:hypothetical protein